MSQIEQSQSLTPETVVELLDIDLTVLGGGVVHIINDEKLGVVFNGVTYSPHPFELTGVSQASRGAANRPDLRISGLNDVLNDMLDAYEDFYGATVRRKKCFVGQLGLVAGKSFSHLEYRINTIKRPKKYVEYGLIGVFDFEKSLPARVFTQDPNSVATTEMRRL